MEHQHGNGRTSDKQHGGVEEFKSEIMKEAKVYVEWAISNSSGENTNIFLDKVEDKMEKHFERNPTLGPADFDKLRSAMMAYAKDFFHAELIPPGDSFSHKNHFTNVLSIPVLRGHYAYFKPERIIKNKNLE